MTDAILALNALQVAELAQCKDVHVHVHSTVTSTNTVMLDSPQLFAHKHVLLAEEQTAGRGRRGKHWVSPFGQNLYLSFAWDWTSDLLRLQGLPIAVGVALASAFEASYAGTDEAPVFKLKWPNDMYWQDRKFGGILTETRPLANGVVRVIVGIGINTLMPSDSVQGAAIDQPWTSLQEAFAYAPNRNQVAGSMVNALVHGLEQFEQFGIAAVQEAWVGHDWLRDQPVTCGAIDGVARGIDASGALIIESDGVRHSVNAGTVSVRRKSVGA